MELTKMLFETLANDVKSFNAIINSGDYCESEYSQYMKKRIFDICSIIEKNSPETLIQICWRDGVITMLDIHTKITF